MESGKPADKGVARGAFIALSVAMTITAVFAAGFAFLCIADYMSMQADDLSRSGSEYFPIFLLMCFSLLLALFALPGIAGIIAYHRPTSAKFIVAIVLDIPPCAVCLRPVVDAVQGAFCYGVSNFSFSGVFLIFLLAAAPIVFLCLAIVNLRDVRRQGS